MLRGERLKGSLGLCPPETVASGGTVAPRHPTPHNLPTPARPAKTPAGPPQAGGDPGFFPRPAAPLGRAPEGAPGGPQHAPLVASPACSGTCAAKTPRTSRYRLGVMCHWAAGARRGARRGCPGARGSPSPPLQSRAGRSEPLRPSPKPARGSRRWRGAARAPCRGRCRQGVRSARLGDIRVGIGAASRCTMKSRTRRRGAPWGAPQGIVGAVPAGDCRVRRNGRPTPPNAT